MPLRQPRLIWAPVFLALILAPPSKGAADQAPPLKSLVAGIGAQISPALTPEQATGELTALQGRIKQCEEAKHPLAPYLKDQAEIIARSIAAIQADRAKKGPYLENLAEIEESECAALLGSLKEELGLIDRNRELAAQAPKKWVNVRELGAVGDGKHDDGPALNEAIRRAAALGPGARVVIPAGRYAVDTTRQSANGVSHLLISGAEDLSVEAEPGATLVMKKIGFGIMVEFCRNVLVRGLSVDADPLPFTQGPIVAVDQETNSFEMEIEKGFPEPALPYFTRAGILRGLVRFPETGLPDRAGGDPRIGPNITKTGPNRYRLTVKSSDSGPSKGGLVRGFTVGRYFSLHARGNRGGGAAAAVIASSYVTLEDIHIYASWDHAYLIRGNQGVKLRGCMAEPLPGTHRFACNVADGIHCPSNRYGPFLENCRLTFVNDDFLNIYGRCHALAKVLGPAELVVDVSASAGPEDITSVGQSGLRLPALRTGGPLPAVPSGPLSPSSPVGPSTPSHAALRTALYRPGDIIAFVNPNDGIVPGMARVTNVGVSDWKGKPRLALSLDRKMEGLVSRDSLGKPPIRGVEYQHGSAKGVIEHFICNLNTKGDGFVVRGCEFDFARGSIAIKASNGIFENNRMEKPRYPTCLRLASEMPWMEGWCPRNVIIRHNTFDNDAGIMSAYHLPSGAFAAVRYLGHIVIEDNDIIKAGRGGVTMRGAWDVTITGNRIQSPRPVVIDNCAEVHVNHNTFKMPADAASKGVELGPRADAPSIEIRDNQITGEQ